MKLFAVFLFCIRGHCFCYLRYFHRFRSLPDILVHSCNCRFELQMPCVAASCFQRADKQNCRRRVGSATIGCYALMTSNYDLEYACLSIIFNDQYFWE